MRIRILQNMVGNSCSRNIGDEIDCDEAEATRLCDKGFAERLEPERATTGGKRNAAKPKGKSRGNGSNE